MDPRCHTMGSRRPKMLPRRLKRPPRGFPRGPHEATTNDFPIDVEGFWPSRLVGFPTLRDGPR
eukprot:9153062-Pyramimonas_sp.AAC.1